MLEEYLSQKALVQDILTVDDLRKKVSERKKLKIMMGQTFDDGQPVDMIKYAMFMMNLGDILVQEGVEVSTNWLIADHFITDINQEGEVTQVREQVNKRISYLQRLNEVYNGDIGFVLSSELSQHDGYKKNLTILLRQSKKDSHFRDTVLKAVPEDRRNHPNALKYPFEEIATIQSMDTDIKIGPSYEVFYDKPARESAPIVGFNRYVAIYLTKGFPFGNPEISEETTNQIEKFGILPYKKGSKGLGEYRIDPVNDDLGRIKSLVHSTRDVRAVIDLLVIAEQARQRLEGNRGISLFASMGRKMYEPKEPFEYDELKISQDLHNGLFQELAFESYKEFIYKPLLRRNA